MLSANRPAFAMSSGREDIAKVIVLEHNGLRKIVKKPASYAVSSNRFMFFHGAKDH